MYVLKYKMFGFGLLQRQLIGWGSRLALSSRYMGGQGSLFFRTDSSDAPGHGCIWGGLCPRGLYLAAEGVPIWVPIWRSSLQIIHVLVLSVRVSIQGSPPAGASWWRFPCWGRGPFYFSCFLSWWGVSVIEFPIHVGYPIADMGSKSTFFRNHAIASCSASLLVYFSTLLPAYFLFRSSNMSSSSMSRLGVTLVSLCFWRLHISRSCRRC